MQENKARIEQYLAILTANNMPSNFSDNESFLKIYAYASQFDNKKQGLKTVEEINNCQEEHIWRGNVYLNWNDEEKEVLNREITHMNNLKIAMELTSKFIERNNYKYEGIFEKFVESINNEFETLKGYEKCWLRFALKTNVKVKEILNEKLELNEKGEVVTADQIPIILKIYLLEHAFTQTREDKLDISVLLKKKRFAYKLLVINSKIEKTLTLEPNSEEYVHSENSEMYLAERSVSRNLDIEYEVGLELEDTRSIYSYEYINDKIEIIQYNIGNVRDNKLEINMNKAYIDEKYIILMEEYKNIWIKEYDEIIASKQKNYDKWIELWLLNTRSNYFEFFNKALPGKAIFKPEGGQRPTRKWIDNITVKDLQWQNSSDLI